MKAGGIKHRLHDFYGAERSMTKTEAYKTLPPIAFRLFHEMLDLHDGSNNGAIGMTIVQAMGVGTGCSRSVAVRELEELRARGLVIRVHKADRTAFGKRIPKDHSLWLLTCYPYWSGGRVTAPLRSYEGWRVGGRSLDFLEDELAERPDLPEVMAQIVAARARREAERPAQAKPQVDASGRQVEDVDAWLEGVPF